MTIPQSWSDTPLCDWCHHEFNGPKHRYDKDLICELCEERHMDDYEHGFWRSFLWQMVEAIEWKEREVA